MLRFLGDILYTAGTSAVVTRSFRRFLDGLESEVAFEHLVVDLSETRCIDSTNLGLLARLVRLAREHGDLRPTLVGPSEDVLRTLETMGFDRVFLIVGQEELPLAGSELEVVHAEVTSDPTEDPRALLEVVLDAHRELMAMSEEGAEVFEDAVALMERELGER